MNVLLIFGTTGYFRNHSIRLARNAAPYFDRIRLMDESDLSDDWKARHSFLINNSHRGFGYWCWRPEIIINELDRLKPEDTLWNVDSTCLFVRSPERVTPYCEENSGILLFQLGARNRHHTKADCLIKMGMNTEAVKDTRQVVATYTAWRKTELAYKVLREMREWCADPQVIGPWPSILAPEDPAFKTHLNDQSILSLLSIKHGVKVMPDISQHRFEFGMDEGPYGQVLNRQQHDPAMGAYPRM